MPYDFTAANATRDTLMASALVAADELVSIAADIRALGMEVSAAKMAEQGATISVNLPPDEWALLHLARSGQSPW